MDLIRVIHWNRYQHYKNRNPPWIKLHRELLTSPTWVNCDDSTRVLAIAIMLLAAQTDNKIPADPKYLQRVAYLSKPPNLKPLIDVQFIEYIGRASICEQTLAPCASTETETEQSRAETEGEKIPRKRVKQPATVPPLDLVLAPEMRAWAIGLGVKNPDQETQKMLDHFRSKGESRSDWVATWRNWMRNSLNFGPKTNGHAAAASVSEEEIEAARKRFQDAQAPRRPQ